MSILLLLSYSTLVFAVRFKGGDNQLTVTVCLIADINA